MAVNQHKPLEYISSERYKELKIKKKTLMKNTYNCNKRLFIISTFVLLFASQQVSSQVSESQQISKSFKVNNNTIIDIDNKYGDVVIETWEGDSVYVEINYEVNEKSRDRLRLKMDQIHFELTHTGHYLVINTIIRNNRNALLNEIRRLAERIGVGESQVQIHMNIKVPDNLDLRIKNKFGNIYIDNYNGNVSIDLSNGRLSANELTGYAKIKVSFGDAIIQRIDTGNLEIYYSDMNLASARRLRINSKTSNITITEVNELYVNSNRDTYLIRMISDFETEANWTNFSINDFKLKSNIKMNYGRLNIDRIRSSIENISIDARSTSISIMLDPDTDMNFDIITNRDIDIPNESILDNSEQINDKDKLVRYTGRTANIDIEKPKLIMNTSSANISILKHD